MVVTYNWRELTPGMVRKLPRRKQLIVHRGEFIQGRYGLPELVFKVSNYGMHLSTYDRVGNAWVRKQGPCQPWTVFTTLET